MFGKSKWFKLPARGWGLRPIVWQGWLYAVVWGAILALPFAVLAIAGRVPEAAIWALIASGVLVWDVRQHRAALAAAAACHQEAVANGPEESPRPDIDFLDDSDGHEATLDTRGYQMSLRNRT